MRDLGLMRFVIGGKQLVSETAVPFLVSVACICVHGYEVA